MAFTGKATYSAGTNLPEIAEDVSDLVAINSPHETPLLDAIGDPPRAARSTVHEWLEDSLLPNTDVVASVADADTFTPGDPSRFRVGDLLRFEGGAEIALVTAVAGGAVDVVRGYGNTDVDAIAAEQTVHIIGNAALEGGDAGVARFTVRTRQQNYTQIFSSTVAVSGSELAVNQIGVRDELAWQKAWSQHPTFPHLDLPRNRLRSEGNQRQPQVQAHHPGKEDRTQTEAKGGSFTQIPRPTPRPRTYPLAKIGSITPSRRPRKGAAGQPGMVRPQPSTGARPEA